VTASQSQPLLCDVIAVPTMAELRARRTAVENAGPAGGAGADLIELRLDTVDRPDVAAALQSRRRPVLVTCRASWEGGHFKGSEEERQRILRDALDAGAEYVDIEWKAPNVDRWLRPEDKPRVVRSFHDFEGMPADLAGVVRDMRATGSGIVKVAARAKALRDLLPLLEVGRAHTANGGIAGAGVEGGQRIVLIAMGMSGVASRILAAHFRSCWTYAGPAVAPGQIEASRLLHEFRFRAITPHTHAYAVVGQPITHSISPAMHNAAFAAEGIDAVYIPCEAADIDDFFALAEILPIVGASVTAPFKLDAYERSEAMDDDVKQVGAANTLRRKASASGSGNGSVNGSGWESRNTDVAGFMAPLHSRLTLRGARAAILGTGGAARAVAVGLGAAGAAVTVHARNTAAGAEVAALANGSVRAWGGPSDSLGLEGPDNQGAQWDLLVNTTPIGTFPAVTDTPVESLARVPAGQLKGRVAYDLVYNPRPTRLLRDAAEAGCATLDGLDMLVEQAARQFEWWTGRKPSTEVMRAAAERRLIEMSKEKDL
jgi:3-dehydroquinate dehydratase / shikimate dehydrogenase